MHAWKEMDRITRPIDFTECTSLAQEWNLRRKTPAKRQRERMATTGDARAARTARAGLLVGRFERWPRVQLHGARAVPSRRRVAWRAQGWFVNMFEVTEHDNLQTADQEQQEAGDDDGENVRVGSATKRRKKKGSTSKSRKKSNSPFLPTALQGQFC